MRSEWLQDRHSKRHVDHPLHDASDVDHCTQHVKLCLRQLCNVVSYTLSTLTGNPLENHVNGSAAIGEVRL